MDKIPPNNQDAEQALIGSCLFDPGAVKVAKQFTEPKGFYILANEEIFKTILELDASRQLIDIISVAHALRQSNRLERCGGTDYLRDCTERVATSAHAEYYAKLVSGLSYERQIINASKALAEDQTNENIEAVRKLVLAKENLIAPSLFNYQDNLFDILNKIEKKNMGPLFDTGYPTIDRAWNGMKPGEVNTWAAMTNDGKSLMLLNLMHRAASRKETCLYVGTEMSAEETVLRHLSIDSRVEAWKIRKGDCGAEDYKRLNESLSSSLYELPIKILDDPEPALKDIEVAIQSSKAKVVFLDYLERFTLPREESLRLRIKEFMRGVKTLARQTNTVIHLASQLNRNAYKTSEAPSMSDISESSAVEKESDRVMLMWSPRPKVERQAFEPREIEIIQAKNRHGTRGMKFSMHLNPINLTISEKEFA